MSLVKAFFTVSGFTLISRISGFARDICIAAIMGAGPLTEVFLVAFKLPNFFRRLFAEGAFNAAFVPMFSGTLTSDGKAQALLFAEAILTVLLTCLLVFCSVMMIAMPWVMLGLAPGFTDNPAQFDLAIYLTRITFPYLLCISLVSLYAGMLNSVGKFAAVAATPILLNLCIIGALLWLQPYFPTPAHTLAWAVAAAGVAQLAWVLFHCYRNGLWLRLRRPQLSPTVRSFLRRMAPGIIGAGIVQINLWVDVVIGTFIPSAIAYLYYADRVNQLPLSIVGTAMGTALLPLLSQHIRANEHAKALHSQNRALETVMLFAIPATCALMVIAPFIITVLFERGAFTAEAAQATAYGLMAYAVGLPAFISVKIFTTSFFAHGDTRTPVIYAMIAMVTNIVLNLTLISILPRFGIMPHIGLALATSFASWLNIALLIRQLARHGHFVLEQQTSSRIIRTFLTSLIMAALLFWLQPLLPRTPFGLTLLITCGSTTFLLIGHWLKSYKINEIKSILRKKPR